MKTIRLSCSHALIKYLIAQKTIIDGKTGFLAEPINVDSLAEKISYALSLKSERREKIGEFAKKFVSKNYSHYRMCNLTLSLYKKCIAEYKTNI